MNALATWTPKFKSCSLGRTISYFVRFEMVFSRCSCPQCFSRPHWIVVPVGWLNGMASEMEWTVCFLFHIQPSTFTHHNGLARTQFANISPSVFLFHVVFLKEKHRLFWKHSKNLSSIHNSKTFRGIYLSKAFLHFFCCSRLATLEEFEDKEVEPHGKHKAFFSKGQFHPLATRHCSLEVMSW